MNVNSEPLQKLNNLMMECSPEMQTKVINMVTSYFLSNQNGMPTCENIKSGCDGGLKVEAEQTQVVMFTSCHPQSRANYAMNNITVTNHTSHSHELSVAVPAEHENSALKHLSHAPDKDIAITEESAPTEFRDQDQAVSSINMTLSAEQINLCKKAKAYPKLTEPGNTICSEQSEFQLEDSNELYAFCAKMNSPDYTALEGFKCFENSTVLPACSPNHLVAPPEYAISAKPIFPTIPSNSQEWDEMSELSDSICGDSDLGIDEMESLNKLQDLNNLLSAYCCETIQSPSATVSSMMVMDPATFSNINCIGDSNLIDGDFPSMESEESNHLPSSFYSNVVSPSSTISSIFGVDEEELNNTSESDVSVESCSLTTDHRSKLTQQCESKLIDCDDYDSSPKKRQRVDGSLHSQVKLDQSCDPQIFNTVVNNELVNQEDFKRVCENHPVFRKDKDGDL